MVEYKVIGSKGDNYLEADLNRLAKDGWRVVGSYHQSGRISATIILERNTEDAEVDDSARYERFR